MSRLIGSSGKRKSWPPMPCGLGKAGAAALPGGRRAAVGIAGRCRPDPQREPDGRPPGDDHFSRVDALAGAAGIAAVARAYRRSRRDPRAQIRRGAGSDVADLGDRDAGANDGVDEDDDPAFSRHRRSATSRIANRRGTPWRTRRRLPSWRARRIRTPRR